MDRSEDGSTLEHRDIPTNGIILHVVLAGPEDGTPIVLLHGFPEFWYSWRNQIGPLAQAGYRVIVPDLRGYNLSSKPHGPRQYFPDALQGDIIGLMEALDLQRAHFVGHDWGGVLAWMLAADNPDRVERLLILNAPHPLAFRRVFLTNPAQVLRSVYLIFFQAPWLPEQLLRRNDYWFLEQALLRTSRTGAFTPAQLRHYKNAWAQTGALTAMLSWYRAMPRYANSFVAKSPITAPTLILWGRKDFALSPRLAELSLAQCRQAELEWVSSAGHWIQHEAPTVVNKRIMTFFGVEQATSAAAASL